MAHAEVIQNGVVIVKPDPRLKRALFGSLQFLSRLAATTLGAGAKSVPGVRSLIRHELILRWLHRELEGFVHKSKYRGKQIYVALDDKLLAGALGRPAGLAKDLVGLVRANAKSFLPVGQLESGIRGAFSLIAREKIHSERQKKAKKKIQTYGEPWQHRAK